MADEIVLSKRALLWRVGLAVLVALVIVFGAVLPAEFGVDPTGAGRLTGLIAMSNKQETLPAADAASPATTAKPLASTQPTPFRSDTIDIPLAAEPNPGYELEYKVKMKAGDTLVYSWTADANVYYDYHGESFDKPKPRVISYRIEDDAKVSYGSLTAPYDGIHGWYLQNHDQKINVVRVKLSGYYEIVMPTPTLKK